MARHFKADDRHGITDPYTDPSQWSESLKKTRIAELFKTVGGLPGHVTQLQQEISRVVSDKNRTTKLEGRTGDDVADLLVAIEAVKSSIVAAAKATAFDFEKISFSFAPFAGDLYLKRTGGKLYRDGKLE